jgi:hypothetical protein
MIQSSARTIGISRRIVALKFPPMSAIIDLSKLPPGANVFFVCVELSGLSPNTSTLRHLSERLYDRLNGRGSRPIFSRAFREEGKEVELPHGHYIICGNYKMDDVLSEVETAAKEVSEEWCRREGRPAPHLPIIVIQAADQKQPARGLNLEPVSKPSSP